MNLATHGSDAYKEKLLLQVIVAANFFSHEDYFRFYTLDSN